MSALAQLLNTLDPDGSQPLYQQLQRALREAIEKRVLGPDDALPSERQLAADLGVSRITVRKAIQGLADEGFLDQRQGSGNFVSTRIDKNFAKLTSFSEDMRARGRTPSSIWLKRSSGTVTPEEAMKLALSPGSLVYRFHRLRYADDAPMALEYATLSVRRRCRRWRSVDNSLSTARKRARARGQPAGAGAAAPARAAAQRGAGARLLDADVGDAGLLVERLGYLRDGRAVELSQSFYRGDTYDFVAELNAS